MQLWGKPRPEQFAQHATDNSLPGYQVFGEGILLVLDPDIVAAWEAKATGSARLRAAAAGVVHQLEPDRPLPWLFAHTLAHLIMRAAAPQPATRCQRSESGSTPPTREPRRSSTPRPAMFRALSAVWSSWAARTGSAGSWRKRSNPPRGAQPTQYARKTAQARTGGEAPWSMPPLPAPARDVL